MEAPCRRRCAFAPCAPARVPGRSGDRFRSPLFLQREQAGEGNCLAAHEFGDLRKLQSDPLERDDLVEAGDLRRPVRCASPRPSGAVSDQPVPLINAKRAHARSEPAGGFCGAVVAGRGWRHGASPLAPFYEPDPRSGSRGIYFPRGTAAVTSISSIMPGQAS